MIVFERAPAKINLTLDVSVGTDVSFSVMNYELNGFGEWKRRNHRKSYQDCHFSGLF